MALETFDEDALDNSPDLKIFLQDFSNTDTRIIKNILKDFERSTITFVGCRFNELNLNNFTFSRPITFDGCDFIGTTTFSACTFPNSLSFKDCVFKGKTTFEHCDFRTVLEFEGIKTTSPTKEFGFLYNTISQKNIYNRKTFQCIFFNNSTFNSPFVFNYLTDINVWFDCVEFNDEFYFTETTFGVKSIFTNTNFNTPDLKKRLMELEILQTALEKSHQSNAARAISWEYRMTRSLIEDRKQKMNDKKENKPADKIVCPTDDRLLTTAQAAALLGLKPSTLEAWRADGIENQPAITPMGRLIRYKLSDIKDFIAKNRKNLKNKKKKK